MINTKKLCELMQEKGISATELAESAGLSKSMMSYVINGFREPSVAALIRISKRLGCTVDELLKI